MNFTLNDINCFIETEKCKEVFPRATFKIIAVIDFCDTPTEELIILSLSQIQGQIHIY